MANIYAYIDYRKFLIDVIAEKKLDNPRFSCRSISMRLGISPATFVRIINGKRNLSLKLLPNFIRYFKLRERAAEYFTLLVELAHVKGPEKKNAVYQKILDFRSERIKNIPHQHHSLFEKSYLAALREVVDIKGIITDFQSLGESLRPPISAREAEKGLKTLLDLNLLVQSEDGRYQASDTLLTTGERWEGVEIRNFQNEMIRLAGDALMKMPKEERDISTLTVGVSSDEILQIKEILRRTRQEILSIAERSKKREYAYQLNFQLFPMSVNLTEGGNDVG